MKILALLLLFSCPAYSQWRPIATSSGTDTAVDENFRRASLWSSRKLDKYSNDVVYGTTTFKSGIKFSDGSILSTAGGISSGLTAPATFYIVKTSDYLVAPASFTYLSNPNAFLTAPSTFYIVKNTDYLISPATFTIITSGDNLGSHIATMTITGNYGASISTLVVTGSQFSVGGSTLVVANGRVGIGTTPGSTLHVNGDETVTGAFTSLSSATVKGSDGAYGLVVSSHISVANHIFSGGLGLGIGGVPPPTTTYPKLYIKGPSALQAGIIDMVTAGNEVQTRMIGSSSGLGINTITAHPIYFETNNVQRMQITEAGHVNIVNGLTASFMTATGASSFGGAVTINAASSSLNGVEPVFAINDTSIYASILAFKKGGAYKWQLANDRDTPAYGLAADDFVIAGGAGVTNRFTIQQDGDTFLAPNGGNVGIGTTGPGYKLDVQGGDVNTSGAYKINGVAVSGLGNVVLASTQTFTGANTFQSTVTVNANGFAMGSSLLGGWCVPVSSYTVGTAVSNFTMALPTASFYQVMVSLYHTSAAYLTGKLNGATSGYVNGGARQSAGSGTWFVYGGTSSMDFTPADDGSAANSTWQGQFSMGYNSGDSKAWWDGSMTGLNGSSAMTNYKFGGSSTQNPTSINFAASSGNITAGKVLILGCN